MWITSEANTCNSQPALLGRRTCLCYGNVSPEWVDSGKQTPAKTHPFRPGCLHCFQTRQLQQGVFFCIETFISTETHDQIFKQAPGWACSRIVRRLRMPAWSLRNGVHLPVLLPSGKSLNFTKPHFLLLYNEVIKIRIPNGRWQLNGGNAYKVHKMVPNTKYVLKFFLFYFTSFFPILLLNLEINILKINFHIPVDGKVCWFAGGVFRLAASASC